MTAYEERIKVAVIGGGLAGLTAAHLLSKKSDMFEVHIFEKNPILGLDAHSISVRCSSNASEQRIDVPMRSFQDSYYKQMIKLYRELGIRFRRCDFTYSFSSFDIGKQSLGWTTYLLYNGRSGVKGFRLLPPSAFKTSSSSESYILCFLTFCSITFANILLLITYIRFIFLSMPVRRPKADFTLQEWSDHFAPTSSFARWIQLDTSWHFFVDMIVVPLFSAVCTAPRELVYEYPAHEILEYVWVTLTSHHYKVESGTRDVVSRLSSNIPYIHTSCSVVSIVPEADSSHLSISTTTQVHTGFSHVIMATEANKGSMLLESYLAALPKNKLQHREIVEQLVACMRTIRYCKAIVINHHDDQVLPPDPAVRRDLNLVSGPGPYNEGGAIHNTTDVLPTSYTMTTHRIFIDDTQTASPVYQTTNPTVKISTKDILSTSIMERAVLTVKGKKAVEQLSVARKVRSRWWWFKDTTKTTLGPLQGAGCLNPQLKDVPGIWICGSYAYHGIPLLEGCVGSAKDIVEQGILPSEGLNTRVSGH